jgi:hypothetical protein
MTSPILDNRGPIKSGGTTLGKLRAGITNDEVGFSPYPSWDIKPPKMSGTLLGCETDGVAVLPRTTPTFERMFPSRSAAVFTDGLLVPGVACAD